MYVFVVKGYVKGVVWGKVMCVHGASQEVLARVVTFPWGPGVCRAPRDKLVVSTSKEANERVSSEASDSKSYPISGLAQEAVQSGRLACMRDGSAFARTASTQDLPYPVGPLMCCPILAPTSGRTTAASHSRPAVIGLLQVRQPPSPLALTAEGP